MGPRGKASKPWRKALALTADEWKAAQIFKFPVDIANEGFCRGGISFAKISVNMQEIGVRLIRNKDFHSSIITNGTNPPVAGIPQSPIP